MIGFPQLFLYDSEINKTYDISEYVYRFDSRGVFFRTPSDIPLKTYKLYLITESGRTEAKDFTVTSYEEQFASTPNSPQKAQDRIRIVVNRLLSQYKSQPNMTKLAIALGVQTKNVEDALYKMLFRFHINPTQLNGQWLDNIGAILNYPRAVASDLEYAMLLNGRICQLASQGTIEDIIDTYSAISGAGRVVVNNLYPAAIELLVDARPPFGSETQARELIQDSLLAGVGFTYATLIEDDTPYFRLSDADDPEPTPSPRGFGDLDNPGNGGQFSEIII